MPYAERRWLHSHRDGGKEKKQSDCVDLSPPSKLSNEVNPEALTASLKFV